MTRSGTPRGAGEGTAGDAGLELLTVLAAKLSTYPLPASGDVSIGRAAECDVRIEDASVSRRHAVLHVTPGREGPELSVEDLGSANGVRVRAPAPGSPHTAQLHEVHSRPGERIPLRVGDTLALGTAMLVVRRAEGRAAPTEVARDDGFVVRDEAMGKVHDLAARVAQGQISVLLLGETGVGKEVLAETVHRRSPRREAPFLRLNCAALSETLL